METRTIGLLLHAWVLTAALIGSLLIIFGSTLLTTIGTVIIILGLVSLMPAFNYLWWAPESAEDGEAT